MTASDVGLMVDILSSEWRVRLAKLGFTRGRRAESGDSDWVSLGRDERWFESGLPRPA